MSAIPKVVLYKNGEKTNEFNGYSPKELEKLKNSCK
jgi:thioredoxin-like negative regulator of GroEL